VIGPAIFLDFLKLGIIVENAHPEGRQCGRVLTNIDCFSIHLEFTHRLVTGAGNVKELTIHPDFCHGHFVLGQGAGLIGADDSGGAERFHRRKPPDEGVALHHLAHPQRQADGDNRGQAFRHCCNRQADGNHEQFNNFFQTFLGGEHLQEGQIGAAKGADKANQEDQGAYCQGGVSQQFTKLGKAFLERSFLFLHALQHGGNQAKLGGHACAGNHTAPAPVGDHRAHEGGIAAIPNGDIFVQCYCSVFLHRHRFAGQGCFFHLEVDRFNQANIRRDVITSLQEDNVTRNQVVGGDGYPVPIPHDLSFRRGHLLQGSQRLLGTAFLDDSKHGIQDDNQHDCPCVNVLAQQGGNNSGNNQQDNDEILELVENQLHECGSGGFHQLVGTHLFQTLGSFVG